ncbi:MULTISPECIES: hypothetical protein [unclassified Nocardioides]|uniref:hypothetical protein n=1 Tax=unclassified Nocardioides TaxID=2615069 RepID=UPI0006FB90BE|nr:MULTISPECIES: hypothetical protein [unclassified Nocardioides]KQY63966.1 hypothetical protein ASD30_03020 [Nocardioides sp. Root140]KRF15980.1 hypothetical protein ASH02_05025 [Nocardioides sp. Soil796]
MKKRLAVTASLAASLCLVLTASPQAVADDKDEIPQSTLVSAPDSIAEGVTLGEARAAVKGDAVREARLEKLIATLPADWQKHRSSALRHLGLDATQWTDAISGVINPDDYECTESPFNQWVSAEVGKIGQGDLMVLSLFGVLDFPTYDALIYETDATKQYFGTHGEYNKVLPRDFGTLQDFWDIKSFDIQLLAMHGEMLKDRARVARAATLLLGVEGDEALEFADLVMEILSANPVLDSGEHPIFTLNAFAFTAEGDPDPVVDGVPDKIVMGDGVLTALHEIGMSQVSGRSVLSHEFGHHVQYEKGLFESDLTGPEATRRTELMADSFGSFSTSHERGLAFSHKKYLEAQRASYEVGDCSFDSDGHHGTPNQRMRAAKWGYEKVQALTNPIRITPSAKLAKQFDRFLPTLVSPDA